MIELRDNELVFRFPEVHEDAVCSIGFQRTLRIPDDNRDYPLPPGLGNFPLNHVDDYKENVPEPWNRHGGIFFPMYQAEAMWMHFDGSYPMAMKIAAGKIDALTGESWKNEISEQPQDYLVVPEQPWLDGFLRRRRVDQAVRGHAPWGGILSRGTTDRRGPIWRTSDHRVPNESLAVRRFVQKASPHGGRSTWCYLLATSRYGLGPGRTDAPGNLRRPARIRFVGYLGAFALLRPYREQRSVPSAVRI